MMEQCEDCGYSDGVHMADCIFNPKNRRKGPMYHVFSWATQSVVRSTSDRNEAERVALTVAVNTGRTTEIREEAGAS